MANKKDGDPGKKGGAYAPKGIKHPAGTKVPARRVRPFGGWITNPIKTTEHGPNGRIALARKVAKATKAAA